MSWGFELWDQYENLASHTQKGIEFLEKYSQFIKERCAIENEYANRLRKLSKGYHPKKKEEEELQFSSYKAFVQMMDEISDMAGQHELIAENLSAQVVKEIGILAKELRDERKSHLQEGTKLQSNLQASLNQLEKAKRCYEKAFKESEKANDNYQKALDDLHLSRIELEKARINSVTKLQTCEDCQTDYANQLQKTNETQKQHYTELMPRVFQQLQDMDEKRILSIQLFMKQTADVQRQVLPFITKCLDETDKAAESIDPKRDSSLVIGRYKSGYQPPQDIAYEELVPSKTRESGNTPTLLLGKGDTLKGTFSAPKMKKRGGLFGIFGANKHNDDIKEDYSDLPPNQRKKKLQQKIESISSQIHQEIATRDGLLKMKAAYEQNTALGDPVSVEIQLPEVNQRIEKLQTQLNKFQGYLSEAEGKSVVPEVQIKNGNSISEESLSRSASESSVHNTKKPTAPEIPLPHRGPGIGANDSSIPDADADGESEYDNGGQGEFEAEPLPALGTARALYPFDAQSEGSIPMEEGEEFEVVELDQGDGWTRVRRANMEEGFVPTSYIECFLYNSC